MSLEVGKNRLEALGDVEEAADLIRYYCQQVEDNDGFAAPMGSLSDRERNVSVLRPYGVWAVISPFNFPMALAGGPAGAALVAGNTVVLKPSPQGSFTAAKLYECFRDAGLDPDVLHLLPGGDEVGAALVAHPGVDGLTFTGSYAVGHVDLPALRRPAIPSRSSARWAARTRRSSPRSPTSTWRRPGWRGPRSGCPGRNARPARGSTCSATCYEDFVAKLAEQAGSLVVGDPTSRDAFVGPVINAESVDPVRAGGRARAARRRGRRGRARAARRGRAARRVLPRAHRGDRAARRRLALPRRAVRAARRRRARTTPWTRPWRWPTTPTWG